jgi:uracil-DNA glycosylase family 4
MTTAREVSDMAADPREGLWDIINDLEDHLRHGMRKSGDRPDLPTPSARPDAEAASGPAADPGGDGSTAAAAFGGPEDSLASVASEVNSCTLCALSSGRNLAVPGTGDAENCQVMVIGEGPGAEEDRQGLPFVGPAGGYLDKWLGAIGLSRENGAFIANAVKCRPPGNRDPLPEETSACMPYLLRQIALVRPRAILCVGRVSTSILLGEPVRISRIRGQWREFRGIPLIATYHPSAVLRNDELRRPVWEDMKTLKAALDSGNFTDEVP